MSSAGPASAVPKDCRGEELVILGDGKSRIARRPTGKRIGLLGGSFNPAHRGHRMISEIAAEHLALDEVWWLVSPQNPLKPEAGMAELSERMRFAQNVAKGASIRVTDIEKDMRTRFTADTLAGLKDLYPWHRFVWLMGADNLIQISRWRHWSSIFHTVPVAVFARPSYSFRAESAKAARRFARYRVKPYAAKRLADMRPPAWVFLKVRLDPTSATELRSRAAEAGAVG